MKLSNPSLKKQQFLLLGLISSLLVIGAGVVVVFIAYLNLREPLPSLIAPINLNYPPHYLFSIYNVDQPVGVTLSPQGDRIYVTESGGERLVKIFSRNGDELGSFAPPQTTAGERSPVYLAADPSGLIYVTDRLQHAVFVYDRDGHPLDTILSPNLTLSKLVAKDLGGVGGGLTYAYNLYNNGITYQSGGEEKKLPLPEEVSTWSPLGIRIDSSGTILLTDVAKDTNRVFKFPQGSQISSISMGGPVQPSLAFGASGQDATQFTFPNSAMADSQGRIYVSDGNNGRISVWDREMNHIFNFGNGSVSGALNLPRGLFIDQHDRLYITDAVGQNVHVFDVSGAEPAFLFSFGDFGAGNGLFNYPNDIIVDAGGRLYIADRENNRVQVWSY